ncbi:MAG: GNAT family N-acetyltransferase [candidate division Zixibacteria bacterium]
MRKISENNFKIVTAGQADILRDENYKMARMVWHDFMLHDPVAKYFDDLFSEPELMKYQFALIEPDSDKIIAMGNSVPLLWEDKIENLPDDGWDWALAKGIDDYKNKRTPNLLCAIQIMVHPDYHGRKLSSKAVIAMRDIAGQNGLNGLIAPVRPTQKCDYPLIPIEKYIKWTNGENLPFDPWLRVHARLGAKIIKSCSQAMTIPGTVAEWEKWTGMRFPESGRYTIPGALVPVDIDCENDKGVYIEPNVWMYHEL